MQLVIEDCLTLDANFLARLGVFTEGKRFSIRWGDQADIYVGYDGEALDLLYNLNGEPSNQTVGITEAPCNFGGVRYYLHCPGCGRRGYKLHLGHSGFYCRNCYQLPYYSQECGRLDGLISQMNKIEDKLDRRETMRMRTTTQMKLINQLSLLEDRIDSVMANRFGDMLAV